jgi:hypothetical protein
MFWEIHLGLKAQLLTFKVTIQFYLYKEILQLLLERLALFLLKTITIQPHLLLFVLLQISYF